MKNIYRDIYPGSWVYTYECPQCEEPIPLQIDLESTASHKMLRGFCQNCHLSISISEKDFLEWEKQKK